MNGLESLQASGDTNSRPEVRAELVSATSLAEIARSLQDVLNRKTVDEILEKLRYGKVRNIVIMGCPGSGKSSVVNGLVQILQINGITVQRRSYEEIYKRFVEERKLVAPDDILTSEAEMSDENRRLLREMLQRAVLDETSPTDTNTAEMITLWEIPAVGEQDRGMSAVKALGKNMDKVTTLFIHVVGERKIYNRAKQSREIISAAKSFDELRRQLAAVGVHITDEDSPQSGEEQLAKYKQMATSAQIDQILAEFTQQANLTYEQNANDVKVKILLSNFRVPDIEVKDDEVWLRQALLFAFLQASRDIFPNDHDSPDNMTNFFVVANMFRFAVQYNS